MGTSSNHQPDTWLNDSNYSELVNGEFLFKILPFHTLIIIIQVSKKF